MDTSPTAIHEESVNSAAASPSAVPAFDLRLLGPIEIWVQGKRQALPRSKKTRALLAYLATTGRAQRRERLCDLLWDVADDPRGALRWSLSRLRREIAWDEDRLEATREEVSLRFRGMRIDAHLLSACTGRGVGEASTEELEALAELPRGSFLEGLELADMFNFNAWQVAQRERYREEHCAILAELVKRLAGTPEAALRYARMRAEQDAFDVAVQTDLLRLLLEADHVEEAQQRFENSKRMFQQLGAPGTNELVQSWRSLATRSRPVAPPRAVEKPAPPSEKSPSTGPFVGRKRELARLEALLGESQRGGRPRVALITGEPGSGKSRLSERLVARAENAGFVSYRSRAFEAESKRPYGAWVDALRVDLGELLANTKGGSREALFQAVVGELGKHHDQAGVVLVLDDLQWLDRDSVELLHFVARTYDRGPLLLALFARAGELGDNDAVVSALRGMRREARVEELALEPLSREDIEALIKSHGEAALKSESVYEACAGNPLYAIELARASMDGSARTPESILQLVRDRIERLPESAVDVLRWSAVLGHAVDVERLEALCEKQPGELIEALEVLERRALLRIDASRAKERYSFSHDLVREAVYNDLSYPRRKLMHKKVATLLAPRTADAAVATEVAHHAGLAGEALPGVQACIVAGTQALRLFAHADAEALAKRGLQLAEQLEEAERVEATLDLLHLRYSARTPERSEAAELVRGLAERALDLGLTRAARLGFQMLSFLRWESASMAAAHDNIMQAERVSRSGEPRERTAALANAAKCLLLLERNLNQAEAFVMEASGLVGRGVDPTSAVSFAAGMIAAHRGELEEAVEAFREARQLSREHGERLVEFGALMHWLMLEIDRGGLEAARELAGELAALGERVRPGAEAPSGRGLLALVRTLQGEAEAKPDLEQALRDLGVVDAKYELSYLLTRWACFLAEQGELESAEARATEALEVARAIGRPSETARALAVRARCAKSAGQPADEHHSALRELARSELSWSARAELERELGGEG